MKSGWIALGLVALAACTHNGQKSGLKPETVQEMHEARDWQHDPGEQLQAALDRHVPRIARKAGRAGTLQQLETAGYECLFGEGHEDYPEPAAVCTRSFATRACQMDWEISLTSDPKRPNSLDEVEAGFRRDCVGTADDWPEPIVSEIDSQLAPMDPPDMQ